MRLLVVVDPADATLHSQIADNDGLDRLSDHPRFVGEGPLTRRHHRPYPAHYL